MNKEILDWFEGNELAANVWYDKYAIKDVERTPEDTIIRLTDEFHRIEQKYPNPLTYREIYDLLKGFKKVIPAGSPIFGIGNKTAITSLSNCYVVDSPVDSYGGIMKTDQELAQLMKRRGGCIEENTNVPIKGKGYIPIKDVQIGDYILSFNTITHKDEWKRVNDKYYTDVKIEDQIELNYSNGIKLKTSKKHPVLKLNKDGYSFRSYNSGELNNSFNKTITLKNIEYYPTELDDIGWWIGCHMGDGTADIVLNSAAKCKTEQGRIRIHGNNKKVIEQYSKICNSLSNSNCSVILDNSYNTKVWRYISQSIKNKEIFDKYLDNQINKKTYTWKIPSFIRKNELYIPFLAGLIDSDGYINRSGRIDISICSKNAIKEIGEYLSLYGQSYSIVEKIPKRKNESIIYNLHIYKENSIYKQILKFINHDLKYEKMLNATTYSQSFKIALTENEIKEINKYNIKPLYLKSKKLYDLHIHNRIKVNKTFSLGKAGILTLKKYKILSESKINEILSRVKLINIKNNNLISQKYIDISVEDNNNYYAGEFGFVNIHNCGIDISTLRPAGTRVSNSAGTSTGAVSFMNRFSNTTREVAQEGRRGALILTIDVTHPDIKKFITAKDDLTKITGANISVKITDEFMQAVKEDSIYEIYHSRQKGEKPIFLKAKEVFNLIVHQAWKTAEPGVLFWDRIIEESPADCYEEFKTISTNPCGELPLCAYDSCRLMHVNIYEYIVNPFEKTAYFDIDLYKEDVYKAQRLMDDMIDLEAEKLDKIIEKIRRDPEDIKIKELELNLWLNIRRKLILGRRTGLNPMLGLADALAALGYKYDSDEAISIADMIAAAGATSAYMSSIHMAMERGSFSVWDLNIEKNNPFLNRVLDCLDGTTVGIYKNFGRRNIACLTIPPSGTISLISQVSSGIEPVFNLSYTRKRKVPEDHKNKSYQDNNGDWWEEYIVYHPKLLKWMQVVEQGKHDGEYNPYRGSTTNEIDPLQKVRMQGIIQQWIDHSISITNNLPENIKEEDVAKIYMEAWKAGCKGCTIYREGSRDGILTNKKKIKFEQHDAPKRPKELICNVHTTKVRGEEFIVIVGLLEDKPYEVFVMRPNGVNPMPKKHKVIKLSKGNYILTTLDWNNKDQGYNFGPIVESLNDEERLITRLISTSLRHGSNINFVVEQLDKSEGNITSFGKAISRVLKKYTSTETKEKCDNCGGNLINEGGCYICPSCGNSKCS